MMSCQREGPTTCKFGILDFEVVFTILMKPARSDAERSFTSATTQKPLRVQLFSLPPKKLEITFSAALNSASEAFELNPIPTSLLLKFIITETIEAHTSARNSPIGRQHALFNSPKQKQKKKLLGRVPLLICVPQQISHCKVLELPNRHDRRPMGETQTSSGKPQQTRSQARPRLASSR